MENYNCFGCSPDNKSGLQMEFWQDGERIISHWNPRDHFQGYINVLHGGIQSTLIDEIGSWVLFVRLNTLGFTSKLSINYINVIYMNSGPISLVSELVEMRGNIAVVRTEITDTRGRKATEGEAEYFTLPEKIARKKYKFPEITSFYSQTMQTATDQFNSSVSRRVSGNER